MPNHNDIYEEENGYVCRQVSIALPDYIMSHVDALRGNVPRATFLRKVITEFIGLDNVYTSKQAWRLLSKEQIEQRQQRVIQLHATGITQRKICEDTGLSQGRVCKIISDYYKSLKPA